MRKVVFSIFKSKVAKKSPLAGPVYKGKVPHRHFPLTQLLCGILQAKAVGKKFLILAYRLKNTFNFKRNACF
jgi:hypothetical protein